jgi:hypothetical protein
MEEIQQKGKIRMKGSKTVLLDMDSFLTFEGFKQSYRAKSYSETMRAMERDLMGKNNARPHKKEEFKLKI